MQPQLINSNLITTSNYQEINTILDNYGVVAYKLSDISTQEKINCIDKTNFYNTANNLLKTNFKVLEPTLSEKLNPYIFKKRNVPDAASGFIHQYFTPIHHLIHNSIDFRSCMNCLYNDNVKYLPNRLRITSKTKYDKNSLHIEGIDIFRNNNEQISIIPGEIAMIVGITGIRKFVFWDIKNKDLKPLYDYYTSKGSKEFTKIDFAWMSDNYPNCRKEVDIECNDSPVLIMWRETTPHEIASSPSLSLFISPTTSFNHTKPKITTLQPLEYQNLTVHQSNLIGMCYNLPGILWPSGKKTYMFCHQRSIGFWLLKIKDDFKNNNKMRLKLISGSINQHSNEYKQKLIEKNIYLPDIIFSTNFPKIVIDITELPDNILKDYGFISENI